MDTLQGITLFYCKDKNDEDFIDFMSDKIEDFSKHNPDGDILLLSELDPLKKSLSKKPINSSRLAAGGNILSLIKEGKTVPMKSLFDQCKKSLIVINLDHPLTGVQCSLLYHSVTFKTKVFLITDKIEILSRDIIGLLDNFCITGLAGNEDVYNTPPKINSLSNPTLSNNIKLINQAIIHHAKLSKSFMWASNPFLETILSLNLNNSQIISQVKASTFNDSDSKTLPDSL
jgi:hypothetical protein